MNQIPDNSKERIIQAIERTKDYLNHEFMDYFKSTNSIDAKDWNWVTDSYLVIFREKPNLPIGFYSKLENLYTNVFQTEANKFMDMCRSFSEDGVRILNGDYARTFEKQYDKWRTDFTIEANKIIQELKSENNSNEITDLNSLKQLVAKGKIDEVITQLIEINSESFDDQNILFGLSFRRRKLEREKIKGVITSEQIELEQNKIIQSLLKMIDELKI